LTTPGSQTSGTLEEPNARKYFTHLRQLQRREWWAWGFSLSVIFLLTFAVASLSLPAILGSKELLWRSGTFQSVSGLVFLIFLFACYLTYEKVLINRLRLELVERQSHSTLWRDLALVDPLTGLYNRRFAERRLKTEISRAQRKGSALLIVLFDLDSFKQINDRYGHSAGDLVLSSFAARLSKAIREVDVAARWGGDEFVLLLPDCDSSQLPSVLRRMESIAVEINGQPTAVGFSAGWAQYKEDQTAQDLIDAADRSLYLNKRKRKELVGSTQQLG
jgi:diguanylate cyclase (GGDEF)-like protein